MYSDGRQAEEGALCKTTAALYNPDGYTAFNTTSGLPKNALVPAAVPGKNRG